LKQLNIKKIVWTITRVAALSLLIPLSLWAQDFSGLKSRLGPADGVVVADPDGRIIFSHNPRKQLIPASTLKLLTALYALDYLGPDFRFQTEFYLQPAKNGEGSDLVVKGYGDPLLISEVIAEIAKTLAKQISTYNDLVLDDTFFDDSVTIPGVSSTKNPYDAPNGALCVNFNTVNFRRLKNGSYTSAEPQTPLLPYALKRIKASGFSRGRIIFPATNQAHLMYAGHLMAHFFKSEGIDRAGIIRPMAAPARQRKLVYRHSAVLPLIDVLSRLLEHSNNFMANQVLVTLGTKRFGTPGTLEKGVKAVKDFAHQKLGLRSLLITEGSGISRNNRISAADMLLVVDRFAVYHHLLTRSDYEFFKTGTLHHISTRAGYIQYNNGVQYRYVIFFNTPGKNAARFARLLQRKLKP
jgi:serine-type D-Ala-D-Ala carboxypeptidase/endopeptidase (penicillin-binding protein 4)